MALSTGQLDRRVAINKKVTRPKPGGGPGNVTTWEPIATVCAKVEGLPGRESQIGTALEGITVYRITMRYRADFIDADQLRYGAIDLNIRSIADPDGRREALVIIADTGSTMKTA